MKRILFLDDMQVRHDIFWRHCQGRADVDHAFTAKEAVSFLNTEPRYDAAYLDHDLAEEHYRGDEYGDNTGMAVVDHIVSMPPNTRPYAVVVHTYNGERGAEMVRRLRAEGVAVIQRRFGPDSHPVAIMGS